MLLINSFTFDINVMQINFYTKINFIMKNKNVVAEAGFEPAIFRL